MKLVAGVDPSQSFERKKDPGTNENGSGVGSGARDLVGIE